MLVVTVRITVKPRFETQFLARVREQARASLANERACTRFDVCHDPSRSSILLFEIYDDAEAFQSHLATRHFLAFDTETRPWVTEKLVERWTLVT